MHNTVILEQGLYDEDTCRTLADGLASAGCLVLLTPPLYHLPDASPLWELLTKPLAVVSGLHARPLHALLRRRGVGEAAVFSARDYPAGAGLLEAISAVLNTATGGEVQGYEEAAGTRWYPLIDGERCVNCGHCKQFCLFGVYGELAGRITVTTPDACKPGCPACSRICPRGAIIFPLYEKEPAIAGAPGQFMQPTEAARRMYEQRTGQSLPEAVGQELDSLIDELDALARRRS